MNWGKILFGLLWVVAGGYALSSPKKELRRGLRWRGGFDTGKIDIDEHPGAVRRLQIVSWLVLLVGLALIGWGLLE